MKSKGGRLADDGSGVSPAAPVGDAFVAAVVALVVRLGVVAWAWNRIPPAADGTFYDIIARRIVRGEGYTWAWPDGTVTYAGHYPVGYPALVGVAYRAITPSPGAAMLLAAILGAASVYAVHRLVARGGSRRQALVAAGIMAVHPGLVSYTPALMTEGITASLVALSLAVFARAGEASGRGRLATLALMGVLIGIATYVRPQNLVLAPLLTVFLPMSRPSLVQRLKGLGGPLLLVSAAALIVLAPWTARNCVRMHRCALVSYNGGWNLLIGTDPDAHGSWAEVKVPPACRDVFDEAEKDACFGREAARDIARAPTTWISLVPAKLAATFDYAGAGPWYLHAANADAFSARAKLVLGGAEVAFERLVLAAGLVASIRKLWITERLAPRAVAVVGALSGLSLFTVHGYLAVIGLVLVLAVLVFSGRARRQPPAFPAALAVLASTVVIHAVFFGAGRYALVTFPVLAALAGFVLPARDASKSRESRPLDAPAQGL